MGRTAREAPAKDMEAYRPLQTLEAFQRDPGLARRRSRAWFLARSAAGFLRKEYGAKRVMVFGSLSRKGFFTPLSDIDLAVWGIDPTMFCRAARAAMDMGVELEIEIDVMDAENCSDAFLKDIKEGGIDL